MPAPFLRPTLHAHDWHACLQHPPPHRHLAAGHEASVGGLTRMASSSWSLPISATMPWYLRVLCTQASSSAMRARAPWSSLKRTPWRNMGSQPGAAVQGCLRTGTCMHAQPCAITGHHKAWDSCAGVSSRGRLHACAAMHQRRASCSLRWLCRAICAWALACMRSHAPDSGCRQTGSSVGCPCTPLNALEHTTA